MELYPNIFIAGEKGLKQRKGVNKDREGEVYYYHPSVQLLDAIIEFLGSNYYNRLSIFIILN